MSLHWGGLVVLLCYDCTKVGNFAYANINFLPRRYRSKRQLEHNTKHKKRKTHNNQHEPPPKTCRHDGGEKGNEIRQGGSMGEV